MAKEAVQDESERERSDEVVEEEVVAREWQEVEEGGEKGMTWHS